MPSFSINGWAVIPTVTSDKLAVGTVPGTNVRLRVREEFLPLALAIALDYHRQVAPLRYGECGGYNYRQANASSSWSDHSSGTAIDLNWGHEGAQGPRGGMATMSRKQIEACARIKARYGVLIWGGDKARGGDYALAKNWDPMHFALKPGVTTAQVRAVIAALHIQPDGTRRPPDPDDVVSVTWDRLKDGDRDANTVVQRALNRLPGDRFSASVTGDFDDTKDPLLRFRLATGSLTVRGALRRLNARTGDRFDVP